MPSRCQKKDKQEIALLKKENKILRSEIKRLNRRLRSYSFPSLDKAGNEKGVSLTEKNFSNARKRAVLLASSSYVKYIWSRITQASFCNLWKRISGFFRKFRLISTTIRIISSAIAIVGTGAFFIFISGTLIFFIPIAILICGVTYVISMLFRKKAFGIMYSELDQKRIFVFFPQRGRPFDKDSCFNATILLIGQQSDQNFIIIVSPYFTSPKGFGGRGYYFVSRRERQNIFIIRKNAFFAFRKKILGSNDKKTSYIY